MPSCAMSKTGAHAQVTHVDCSAHQNSAVDHPSTHRLTNGYRHTCWPTGPLIILSRSASACGTGTVERVHEVRWGCFGWAECRYGYTSYERG